MLVFQEKYGRSIQLDKGISWKELLSEAQRVAKEANEDKHEEERIYPFALPPLDTAPEFVAFFMEILLSLDGDIYEFKPLRKNLKNDAWIFDPGNAADGMQFLAARSPAECGR